MQEARIDKLVTVMRWLCTFLVCLQKVIDCWRVADRGGLVRVWLWHWLFGTHIIVACCSVWCFEAASVWHCYSHLQLMIAMLGGDV